MTGQSTSDGRRPDRAAYREFVRRTHPDRGGDPAEFVAGLRRFREQPGPDRYDAPISVVRTPTGVHAVTDRVRRWWERRTRPPRVQ